MSRRSRYFRPTCLVPIGLHLVVIDEMQPVAIMLNRSGRFVQMVTWEWAAGPTAALWPPRTVAYCENSVWVDDRAGADVIRIDSVDDTEFTVTRTESIPEDSEIVRVRRSIWRSRLLRSDEYGSWDLSSSLKDNGTAWDSTIARHVGESATKEFEVPAGFGAFQDAVVLNRNLFATMRRAAKRPWSSRPPAEVLRVETNGDVSTVVGAQEFDITSHCRGESPFAPSPRDVAVNGVVGVLQSGDLDSPAVSNPSVRVSDWEADPVLDIRFEHEARPGLQLVRREYLLHEFGFAQDSGDFGVFLSEDILTEFFPPSILADGDVLYI
ncbi:hypothetical protein [Prauserella halophila]|nr:hypothetical protein [Prauserella halophila]